MNFFKRLKKVRGHSGKKGHKEIACFIINTYCTWNWKIYVVLLSKDNSKKIIMY